MSKTGSAAISGDLRHTVPANPLGPLGPVDRRLLRGAGLTGTVDSLLLLATVARRPDDEREELG